MRGRVVVGVVAVGLLVGGAAVADGVARERTQERLAAELQRQIVGLSSAPDVTISGFPFLTQVLAGELDDVRLSAADLTVEGLRLEDVDVRLTGVTTDQPTTARHATLNAATSLASIQEAVGASVELAIADGLLVASGTLLGVPLEVLLIPRPDGRAIAVDIDSLRVGGRTVDVAELPDAVTDQFRNITIPIDGLPQGIELTAVELTTDGALLEAQGDDVVFDATSLG